MTKGRGARSIARNALYLLGGQGAEVGTRLLYAFFLGRVLGAGAYGLYAYGTSATLVALPLAALGLDQLVGRVIGVGGPGHRDVVAGAFTLRLLSSGLAVALLVGFARLTETSRATADLVSIFAVGLFGRSLAEWAKGALVAHERANASVGIGAALRLGEVGVGVALLLAGAGVGPIAWLYVAQWWGQAVVGLVVVHTRFQPLSLRWDRQLLRRLVVEGGALTLAGLATAWMRHGTVLSARWSTARDALGSLALVMQFTLVSVMPFVVIAQVAIPVLSRSVVRGDGLDLVFVRTLVRLSAVYFGLAIVVAHAVGPDLVVRVFGAPYAPAGTLLPLGFAAAAPASWHAVLLPHRVASGTSGRAVLVAALSGAVTFTAVAAILLGPLGPAAGLVGCAAGFTVSAGSFLARWPAEALRRVVADAGLGAFAIAGAVVPVHFFVRGPLGALVGTAVLVVALRLAGVLDPRELRELYGTLRGGRPRPTG